MGRSESLEIRALGVGDVGAMRSLLGVFGEAFDEPATFCDAQPSDGYLKELLGSDTFIALAAFKGGRVVGGLAAYELRKYERERSEIYIYDLAVCATHRRHGVATGLIVSLKRIAQKRGAWVIFVQADLGDEPAIALYTSLGQREDVLHFDILPD